MTEVIEVAAAFEVHRDLEVGRDADGVGVERGVMQLAEREAVGNYRLADRVDIRR